MTSQRSDIGPTTSARPSPLEPSQPASATARLMWPGRVWEPGAIDGAAASGGLARTIRVEMCRARADSEDGKDGAPDGRLMHGDALDVARALRAEGLSGTVDVVYIDPPFASQALYVHEARIDGPADGRILRASAYDDRWDGDGIGGYLDMLAPRIEALAALLAPSGTIWVHADWRAAYLLRTVLDEVLGRDAFVNEIVWRRAPNLGRQAVSHQFGRTLDTIVVYGKGGARLSPPTRLEPIAPAAIRRDEEGRPFTTAPRGDYTDESIARLAKEGRVHRTASGRVYVKYFLVKDRRDVWCRERRIDALWADVPPLRHARPGERTGYPTQKPRALLDRIVACAAPAGGLVVDLFSGSGTTGESARALGRRFILGDVSALAIATSRARLLRGGADVVVERCGATEAPEGPAPRVAVERTAEGARVDLIDPAEPLAWAIDAAYEAGGPFRTDWHAERSPGSRTRAAPRQAVVERAGGPIAVRVWYDDGRVGTFVEESTAPGEQGEREDRDGRAAAGDPPVAAEDDVPADALPDGGAP